MGCITMEIDDAMTLTKPTTDFVQTTTRASDETFTQDSTESGEERSVYTDSDLCSRTDSPMGKSLLPLEECPAGFSDSWIQQIAASSDAGTFLTSMTRPLKDGSTGLFPETVEP